MKALTLSLLFLVVLTGCQPPKHCTCIADPQPVQMATPALSDPYTPFTSVYAGPNPSKFKSCGELKEYAEQIKNSYHQTGYQGGYPTASCDCDQVGPIYDLAWAEPLAASDSRHSEHLARNIAPNTQEAGLQESDFVKWSNDQIFVAGLRDLTILDRRTLRTIGKVALSDSDDFYMTSQLLVSTDNLIVISSKSNPSNLSVNVFTLKAGQLPTLTKSHIISGTLKEARLQSNQALLVVNDQIIKYPQYIDYVDAEIIGEIDIDDLRLNKQISCDSIIKRTANEFANAFTAAYSLDLSKPSELNSLAVLGTAEQVYITADKVFVSDTSPYEPLVTQINYNSLSGFLDLGGVAAIKGQALNEWSFNYNQEKNFLSVAIGINNSWPITNSLQNLRLNPTTKIFENIGSVSGFGTNENIKSVRFIGDLAYVVTFRQTDPLHVIDNSNPSAPKIVSELVVPGFSSYLHPLNEHTLMGVGANGNQTRVQLSLFDISNSQNISRTDNIEVGFQNSQSDANLNHLAFFYDSTASLVALPIVESSGYQVTLSGAKFYQTTGARLSEYGQISHADLIPVNYLSMNYSKFGFWGATSSPSIDINRIFKIDSSFLSVSRFGVKFHNAVNPSRVEASEKF